MGKQRKKTHEFSDQFGEWKPQDREEQTGFSAGGGANKGGAGKRKANDTSLSFQRQLPKFLQPYAHMLGSGQGQQDEDEPVVLEEARARQDAGDESDDEERRAEEEAIQRALEENPALAAQLDAAQLAKLSAGREKEAGNAAFQAKDFAAAHAHFSRCIELDPKDAVFHSNRSAAAANLGRYEEALADAKAVLRLKPGWVKGHARAGAAYMGLELYSEAKEAYERAAKLEPDDQGLRRLLDKAAALELQHMRERKHVFKKGRLGEPGSGGGGQQTQPQDKQLQDKQPQQPPAGRQRPSAAATASDGERAKQQQKGSSSSSSSKAGAKQRGSGQGKLSFVMDEEDEAEG